MQYKTDFTGNSQEAISWTLFDIEIHLHYSSKHGGKGLRSLPFEIVVAPGVFWHVVTVRRRLLKSTDSVRTNSP